MRQCIGNWISCSCYVPDVTDKLRNEVQVTFLTWRMSVWLGLEAVSEWFVVSQHMKLPGFQEVSKMVNGTVDS